VRQISKIWVVLPVADFTTGFQILLLPQQLPFFFFQSADCTGQAYLFINPSVVNPDTGNAVPTSPAIGYVATILPATAPSIYFAGSPATLTINSVRSNTGCNPWSGGNPNYVGPVQSVPVSSLGLTLPFKIE
jgi:hypothetical protein